MATGEKMFLSTIHVAQCSAVLPNRRRAFGILSCSTYGAFTLASSAFDVY